MSTKNIYLSKNMPSIWTARGRLSTTFNEDKTQALILHKENGIKQKHATIRLHTKGFSLIATAKLNDKNHKYSPSIILSGNMNHLSAPSRIKDEDIETLPEELWMHLQSVFLNSTHMLPREIEKMQKTAINLLKEIAGLDLKQDSLISVIQENIHRTKHMQSRYLHHAIQSSAALSKQTHDQLTMGG